MYKSTDLQTALARGRSIESTSDSALSFKNDFGIAGSQSDSDQMSFFWIHNYWGGGFRSHLIGGTKLDKYSSSRLNFWTQKGYTDINAQDYTCHTPEGVPKSSTSTNLILKVKGTTESGFFPKEWQYDNKYEGYYCDDVSLTVPSGDYPEMLARPAKRVEIYGGGYLSTNRIGPFAVDMQSTYYQAYCIPRLSYRL